MILKVVFALIGISLALFFTVRFVISLGERGKTRSKVWKWIKNVIDAIRGIG